MNQEELQAPPADGPASADSNNQEPEGAATDLHAENTRLRQELARNKQVQRDALPYVQLAVALDKAPGGKAIIAKLEKGEPLTEAQQEKVDAAASSPNGGLTKEDLAEALNQFENKLYEKDKATETMRGIYERGKKELPGYENIYKSPEWNRRKAVVLALAQNDPSMIPDDESEPYWWVEKETYATLLAQNPDLGKDKPAKKTDAERKGAISRVSPKSEAAPEETEDNLPDYVKKLRDGTNRQGKTLGSLRRSGRQ